MENKLLEVSTFTGDGYKPLIDFLLAGGSAALLR